MIKRFLSRLKLPCLAIVLSCGLLAPISSQASSNRERIAGENRYKTSVEISKKTFQSAETVILASGENFPDALAGGQLALAKNGPILLNPKNSLDKNIHGEIKD